MTHENGKNIGGGAEYASPDERKIAGMLSSLKRVEAPKDFDFHLKARIANARPADVQPGSLLPILKYALPLALFLFAGAGIMLYSSFNGGLNQDTVQVPGQTAPVAIQATTPAPDAKSSVNNTAAHAQDQQIGVRAPQRVSNPSNRVTGSQLTANTRTPGHGRSRDFTPSSSVPPGNSAVRALGISGDPITPVKRIKAAEALKLIGIEADFVNNGWTVKSVKSNEIAGQLGVKPGDQLKAVDGNPIDDKTEFKNEVKINNSIQVVRGSDTILLTVKKPDDR